MRAEHLSEHTREGLCGKLALRLQNVLNQQDSQQRIAFFNFGLIHSLREQGIDEQVSMAKLRIVVNKPS